MPTIADWLVAVIVWAILLYKAPAVLRRRRSRQLVTGWLFILFFALSVTLRLGGMVLRDWPAWSAWALSYLTRLAAAYFCVAALHHAQFAGMRPNGGQAPQLPRWIGRFSLATAAVMVVVFGVSAALVAADSPRDADAALVQYLVNHGHLVGMALATWRLYAGAQRRERVLATRLRLDLMLLASGLFALYNVLKAGDRIYGHLFQAATPLPLPALLLTCVTAFALYYLPQPVFVTLADGLLFGRKVRLALALRTVTEAVARYHRPIVALDRRWWRQWHRLDFVLYRSLIDILDAKYLWLQTAPPATGPARLAARLRAVDDDQPYEALLAAYAGVGRALRRDRHLPD